MLVGFSHFFLMFLSMAMSAAGITPSCGFLISAQEPTHAGEKAEWRSYARFRFGFAASAAARLFHYSETANVPGRSVCTA
jgi:hypothetical protein